MRTIWKYNLSTSPKLYTAPPANNQSEQHLEMVNAPALSAPVLTVECEPDYWSGGHYHDGTMPYIDPTAVWKLPIGTELYTAPPAPRLPDGWKLVPVIPTPEMVVAWNDDDTDDFHHAYRAMLAAAPEAPAPPHNVAVSSFAKAAWMSRAAIDAAIAAEKDKYE